MTQQHPLYERQHSMKDSKKSPYLNLIAYTPAGTATAGIIVTVIAGLRWGLVAAASVLAGASLLKLARRRHPLYPLDSK